MADPMNPPVLRKRMVVCRAVGAYINGEQEGTLSPERFRRIVENSKKRGAQIPIYNMVGKPESEHPQDLDKYPADGWAEGLMVDPNGDLSVDAKIHGNAAVMVAGDQIRGASIGTKQKPLDYQSTATGEVLDHIILTNDPYVKGLNVAAAEKGAGVTTYIFTALAKESPMPEPDKKPDSGGDTGGDALSLQEKLTAAECLLQEKEKQVRDLTDANENLTEELRARQKNTDLETALKENRKLLRRLDAGKVRELVGLGVSRGQFKAETVRGYDGGEDRSDEITLSWFKNSIFGGDMEKLSFALKTFPKVAMRRTFATGDPGDMGETGLSPERRTAIEASGHDPDVVAATRGAANLTEFKRRKQDALKKKGA